MVLVKNTASQIMVFWAKVSTWAFVNSLFFAKKGPFSTYISGLYYKKINWQWSPCKNKARTQKCFSREKTTTVSTCIIGWAIK